MSISSLDITSLISIFSLIFSIFTIIIAVLIFIYERKQLEKQENILEDTHSITTKLSTEASINKMVNKLFLVEPEGLESQKKYKIMFPATHLEKPLPLIHQGDFFAIHIISLFLGIDKIEFIDVDGSKNEDINSSEGNIIFICSPQANAALKAKYPSPKFLLQGSTKTTDDNESNDQSNNIDCKSYSDLKEFFVKEIKLPCWFIEVFVPDSKNGSEGRWEKRIQIYDKDLDGRFREETPLPSPIVSPAEEEYRMAEKDKQYRALNRGRITDYGIFARITDKNKHFLIIAGIHQYGTWIVGDFLRRLLYQELEDEKQLTIFKSNDDFLALIKGDFASNSLTVITSMVDDPNLWVKNKDEWERYK